VHRRPADGVHHRMARRTQRRRRSVRSHRRHFALDLLRTRGPQPAIQLQLVG
jgi:hypothetical protein